MRSEGFPFIVWGSGGWTLVHLQLESWSSRRVSRRFRVVNSVSMEKAAKPRLFCCAHVAVSMAEAPKPISSQVFACPLASPCLWGKLQNLVRLCCAHIAVSMGEAAKPQSLLVLRRRRVYGGSCKTSVSSRVSACPLRSFCCAHVDVSMGEAAKLCGK